MLNKVSNYIDQFQLLDKNKLYLVALSGGADSVALLLALHQLGYRLETVHCNFKLRGSESDRDEIFCNNLADKLNIKHHIIHFETNTYAQLHKVSVEMAARELRYKYFESLMGEIGASGICIAHHKEDSVETILLNLIRGTGLKGLTGIKPINGNLIRPLLPCTRQEIERFLKKNHQNFVIDGTNYDNVFHRNKLRNSIIPIIKEINPSFDDSLLKLASIVSGASLIVENSVTEYITKITQSEYSDKETLIECIKRGSLFSKVYFIDINAVKEYPSPSYLLYFILSPLGFSSPLIDQIAESLDSQTGKTWKSHTHELFLDRGKLILSRIIPSIEKEMKIPEEGRYIFSSELTIVFKKLIRDNIFVIPTTSEKIAIDVRRVQFPLLVRPIHAGDRFIPFGMKGSKLVSDFLTDIKMNVIDRRKQLVLCDAGGNIIWLVGQRLDNRYRIDDTTVNLLLIHIERTFD